MSIKSSPKKNNKPDEPDGRRGPLPPWPAMILSGISYKMGKIQLRDSRQALAWSLQLRFLIYKMEMRASSPQGCCKDRTDYAHGALTTVLWRLWSWHVLTRPFRAVPDTLPAHRTLGHASHPLPTPVYAMGSISVHHPAHSGNHKDVFHLGFIFFFLLGVWRKKQWKHQ